MTSLIERHPSNEVLERYALGHLPEFDLEQVEEHLLVCELCQDEMTLVDSYIREIKEVCRAEVVSRSVRSKPKFSLFEYFNKLLAFPRPVLAGACAAAALIMVVPFVRQSAPSGPPLVIQLQTERGFRGNSTQPKKEAGVATAQANRPLELNIALGSGSDSGPIQAEIVKRSGAKVWTGTVTPVDSKLKIQVASGLRAGSYWVRLFDASHESISELGLELK